MGDVSPTSPKDKSAKSARSAKSSVSFGPVSETSTVTPPSRAAGLLVRTRSGRKFASMANMKGAKKVGFKKLVKRVSTASMLGWKCGPEAVVRMSAPELVVNGPFIDSLHRLLPSLAKQHSKRLHDTILSLVGDEAEILLEDDEEYVDLVEEHDILEETNNMSESTTLRLTREIVAREKLTATVSKEVEDFWRQKHEKWPIRVPRRWAEPSKVPSAGLFNDAAPSTASSDPSGGSVARRLVMQYSSRLRESTRHREILKNKADAWLAINFPHSRIGLRTKAELTRTVTNRMNRMMEESKEANGGGSPKSGAGKGGKGRLPRLDSAGSIFRPGSTAGRNDDGRPSPISDLAVAAPSTSNRLDPFRQGWTDSRCRRNMWKTLPVMPCKEVQQRSSRWMHEGKQGCFSESNLKEKDSSLGKLEEWPPNLPKSPKALSTSMSSLRLNSKDSKPTRGSQGRFTTSTSLPFLHRKKGNEIKTPATPRMMREEEERAATPCRAACCPTKQLLHAEFSDGRLPELPIYANDRYPSVAAKVRDLGCGDRVALTASGLLAGSVQSAAIEEVDLGGNVKLDESQLNHLMKSLCNEGASLCLRKLSLRRCVGVGMGTLSSIIKLMSSPSATPRLRHLDLSGVQIGLKSHKPLCAAIRDHTTLKDLRLADAGLGSGIDVKGCIADLLASRSVKIMDLSWNCFSYDIFASLGEQLAANQTLRSLNLANCAEVTDTVTPAAFFVEHLARDKALHRLDLSLNRIDFRAALCLEDAMESNSTMVHLDLSHNPLGVDGIRSSLRMLTRQGSALYRLTCEGCDKGYAAFDEFPWEPANPAARYNLDLERPQDRALLRMIGKLCHRLGASMESCMSQIVSNPKYKPPEGTDHHGLIEVPSRGTLSFTFCVAKALEGTLGTASDFKLDVSTFLEKQASLLRHIAGRRREHLLIGFWRQFSGMSDRQHLMLNAITKDFAVTPSQLLAIYEDEADHHATITHSLLPCLTDGLFARYTATTRMQNLSSCVTLYRRAQSLLAFNPEHTTGHYKLDLEVSCSRIVTQKLMLLDAWETLIDQQLGRPDTSQRGNRSHFRNERYLNSQVPAASVAEWNLPPSGIFEFDYATSQRPSLDAIPLSKNALNNILLTMGESTCSVADKLSALRQNADQVYLTAMQLRELMGIFKDEHSRCEIFIIFAFRVTDIQNRKLIMTRVEDTKTLNATYLRIGHATFFPFVQPEQALFELDLTYHDQRLCLNLFCLYSVKERRENLRDVQYELPDGSKDKLETGVPKTWETLSKVPTVGVVRGRYVCAPEHRKIQMRQEFLETYGLWTFPDLTEEKVYWWYTMSDVPILIIHLISYIMSTWDIRNPSECYSMVVKDKPFIGLGTFEDAFSKRFGPAVDNSPLKELFRYFDDSGDGKVSEKEWSTLDQVWAEVRLSVQEFAQFLERMFKEEVTDAWDFFDSDNSGTVTEDEWSRAVQSLGYFGPLKIIFAFLDPTGRGVLQKQAFVHLANFKKGILAFKTHS